MVKLTISTIQRPALHQIKESQLTKISELFKKFKHILIERYFLVKIYF